MRILGVLVFLAAATTRNRVKAQLLRLRRPKYLVATAFALLYLWFFFGRRLELGQASDLGQGARQLIAAGAGAVWLLLLLGMWIFGRQKPALAFSEAEIQLLFPAPLSRRALLLYKIGRSLLLVGVSALITTVIFGARLSGSFWFFLAGAWSGLGLHALHEMGAQLTRARLLARGTPGRLLLVAGVTAVVAGLAVAFAVSLPRPLPALEAAALSDWVRAALAGPAGWALAATRAPLEVALAPDLGHFLRWLPLPLALGAAQVAWILRSDAAFEEASVDEAERRARQRELRRGTAAPEAGRPKGSRVLGARGRPEWALAWKNVIAARRLVGARLWGIALPVGAMTVSVGVLVGYGGAPGGVATGIAVALGGLAAFLSLVGPGMLRSDFRGDHAQMDVLRAMPLSGAQVVAGEVAGPWALLAGTQWGLLAVSAIAATAGAVVADARGLLATVLAAGLGAALVLPCVTLVQLLVQNAVVLILPGWAETGVERARGLEAFGQRLLLFLGSMLVLGVAFLPAGLLGALVGALGWAVIGAAALPLAGMVVAAVLLAEAAAAVLVLGRVFDDYDVTSE